MSTQLAELMKLIVCHWPFDDEHYEGFSALPEHKQDIFKLRHINDHQRKASDKFTVALEPTDHRFDLDRYLDAREEMRKAVVKQFINTLRAAFILGVSGEQLEQQVRAWGLEKHNP